MRLPKSSRLVLRSTPGLEWGVSPSAQPGVYVVLGRNNAGKTRFLEAIQAAKLEAEVETSELSEILRIAFVRILSGVNAPKVTLRWVRTLKSYAKPSLTNGKGGEHLLSVSLPSEMPDELVFFAIELMNELHGLMPVLHDEIWDKLAYRPAEIIGTDRHFADSAHLNAPMVNPMENTAAYVDTLQRRLETKKLIGDVFQAFEDITEGLKLDIEAPPGDHLARQFVVSEPGGPPRSLSACGDGLRDLLYLVLRTFELPSHDLLVDEPGLRLHPHAQRRLLSFLKEAARERSVWIAAHDPAIVGSPAVSARYAIRRANLKSVATEIAALDSVRVELSDLGWQPRDMLLADCVVYCEGASDEAVFSVVLGWLAAENPSFGGTVVEMVGGDGAVGQKRGKSQVLRTIELLKKVAPHARHIVLFDQATTRDPERRGLAAALKDDVRVVTLERTELEDFFLDAALIWKMVQAFAVQRQLTLVDVDAVVVAGCLIGSDKGSAKLDRVWHRCFQVAYDKVWGAKAAVALIRETSPSLVEDLCNQMRRALQ